MCLPNRDLPSFCGCASDADCDDGDPETVEVCRSYVEARTPTYCCGICELATGEE